MEYICIHPETKELSIDRFNVEAIIKPRCPQCGGIEFSVGENDNWRCDNCEAEYTEDTFAEYCMLKKVVCVKCGTKLIRVSVEGEEAIKCPECLTQVPYEESELEDNSNVRFEYTKAKDGDTVLRLYKCPIYDRTMRIDSTYCKQTCGYRADKDEQKIKEQ